MIEQKFICDKCKKNVGSPEKLNGIFSREGGEPLITNEFFHGEYCTDCMILFERTMREFRG